MSRVLFWGGWGEWAGGNGFWGIKKGGIFR
jgi:hypothetical protein